MGPRDPNDVNGPSDRRSVIRVITRLNIGGPARHVIHLTAGLPARGLPSVLVAGRVDPGEGDMSDLARANGIVPVTIPSLRNGGSPVDDLRALLALYRLFRRMRPAIVHLHLLKARAVGGLAARLAGVPVIVETFHGTLFTGYYPAVGVQLLVGAERFLARWMRAVVAVSDAVATELMRHRIAPAAKITVIPLGLDLERLAHDGRTGQLRRELGLPDGTHLVGCVGRMVPIKGLSDLLDAAALVVRTRADVVFLLVGDGTERAALEQRARALGIAVQVRFLGWRTDLEQIYPDLDVVVLSSRHEGTPVSLIEAMAARRSVVATRVGGVPDVVQDGETGVLVPPGQPAALAEAILRVLGDPVLRRRLGAAARGAVYPRYGVGPLLDNTAALYTRLLDLDARG